MTSPGKNEIQAASRAVNNLLQHRGALPGPLEASLRLAHASLGSRGLAAVGHRESSAARVCYGT